MAKHKKRPYQSAMRQRQAEDTRRRIVVAAGQLLQSAGYAGMTVDALARRSGVSVPSVYAIFKSKTGILTALLDRSAFGLNYEATVRQALAARDPGKRLRLAARIARQIHDAQSATFDLLRGAGVVAPELAKLERQRECLRYERQEQMIISLRDAQRLKPELDYTTARDVFWMLTGQEVYRMLVGERRWSSDKYENWLGRALVAALLRPSRTGKKRPLS